MTDAPIGPGLFQPEIIVRWLPGFLFGLILYMTSRRFSHFLLLPILLLIGVGSFYLILFLGGGSLETAVQGGWLLGPFPEGSLWQPAAALVLADADWSVLFSQAVTLSTIFLVAAISLLMNATGLEITTNKDLDLNRKLITAGIGNIIAGLGGSTPGYQSVSLSTLGYKLGVTTRIVGITSLPPMRFLLLDFRLVSGIDSSATLSMKRLLQLARNNDVQIVLTSLAKNIQIRWAEELYSAENPQSLQIFPDLDKGVAWCEQVTINSYKASFPAVPPKSLSQQLDELLPHTTPSGKPEEWSGKPAFRQEETAVRVAKYLSQIVAAQDQCLLREGSKVNGLYFVESGQIIAKSINHDDQDIELRTLEAGTVFGEIGVYSHLMATADVTAGQPSTLLYLSAEKLKQMEAEDPPLAMAFHRLVAGILAEKLAQSSQTVRALLS